MTEQKGPLELTLGEQRRRFLRLAGSAAALLPIAVITGCGNDAPPAAPRPAPPAAQPTEPERMPAEAEAPMETAPEPVPESTPEPPAEMATESLPILDLNDPTAQALGYQHDASLVDPQQFPQFRPGNLCSNCALYTGQEGAEWGPCGLFPGKAVNVDGWCNAWAPRRG
ncbi:MAG: high-potential iron-sulfur protein [Wenzhouxiangella sp.]